jgi:hypothetical protein
LGSEIYHQGVAEGFLWGRSLEPFVYPVAPAPRTAVLAAWFNQTWLNQAVFRPTAFRPAVFKPPAFRPTLLPSSPIRIFRNGWGPEAEHFQPAAVAATLTQCRKLSRILIPSLTHALIVLERPGAARLSEADRDLFWRAFRVPVFEQIIGPKGQLLAGECEAHDGLHLEAPGLRIDAQLVDMSLCPCGRKTPRFGVQPKVDVEKRATASAG